MGVAGYQCELVHVPGPQGVRGRNSNNDRLKAVLGWVPPTPLAAGLAQVYEWIESEVRKAAR
jgi:nucleoside-diphosphate-sugar epimerase